MSYPILYKSTETNFETNGIGVLSDAVSCVVSEERNGPYELVIVYPVDGIHYDEIQDRSIILAKPNPVDESQPFRVYSSTKPLNGLVTFYAQHISYDLTGIPVSPFTANNIKDAFMVMRQNAVVECPYNFYTDKVTSAKMDVKTPSPIRNLLGGQAGSILDVYGGGDYKFDRYNVWLYQNRGKNRGVSIRYGKNLTDLEQERNCSRVYTGVYPYWTNTDGELVQLQDKIVNAPGSYDFVRIMTLDLSQELQDKPSEEQLRESAEKYIESNNIGVPSVSLTVSHVMLENTEEYKGKSILERIDLCDTVNIEFAKLGVSATAQAVKAEYNVISGRYESITFGDARTNLADTAANQTVEIKQTTETTRSFVEQASRELNEKMQNASGLYPTEQPQPGGSTIWLLHDKQTLEESSIVIKISDAGIGLSTDGGNSYPYGYTVTGEMVMDIIAARGIKVEWLLAGILDAAKIVLSGEYGSILQGKGGTVVNGVPVETSGLMALGPKGLAGALLLLSDTGGRLAEKDGGAAVYVGDGYVTHQNGASRIEDAIAMAVKGTTAWMQAMRMADGDPDYLEIGEDRINLLLRAGQRIRLQAGEVVASGAVVNMGISSLSIGSTSWADTHSLYVIIGRPNTSGSRTSMVIASDAITSGEVSYQLADNDGYRSFFLSKSGGQIRLRINSGVGEITSVYGVL